LERPRDDDATTNRQSHLRLVRGTTARHAPQPSDRESLRMRASVADRELAAATNENLVGSWLELVDLMTQFERKVASFEAERRAFDCWAARERAGIERERMRLRRADPGTGR
jgi:hypothetical protein